MPKKNVYSPVYFFLRPLVRWVFDFRCYICSDISFAHDVHHIDKKSSNNDAMNLVPLCTKCHANVHGGWLMKEPFRTEKQIKLLTRLNQLANDFAEKTNK